MSRSVVVGALALGCSVNLAAGLGPCENNITFEPDFSRVTAIARCAFTTLDAQNNRITVAGEATLNPGDAEGACSAAGYCGMTLQVALAPSTTYTSKAKFNAYEYPNMIPVASATADDTDTSPAPQRPRSEPPPDTEPTPINFGSPIVISFSGRYSLSGLDDPVWFDIDADGVKDGLAWTAAGSDDAFLALDRDGNGVITDGSELFGDATRLRNGRVASNGFEALQELDDNADGVIDSRDRTWPDLILWQDRDHDGVSSAAEQRAVENSSVVGIGLTHAWSGRCDRFGNEFRYRSAVEIESHGQRRRQPVYDIFFVTVR